MDVLIRGARLDPDPHALCCDIAIERGRITKIGTHAGTARLEIDAAGLVAVPGFIDFHNHTDVRLLKLRKETSEVELAEPVLRNHNFLHQGVTTVVTGNCGDGMVDIDEWRALFERRGFGTNVCHFVPYGSLRRSLFGSSAENRALDRREIERVKAAISNQLEKGARGFSVAFDSAPQCYATTEELIEYCAAMAANGGIYLTHIRHERGHAMLTALDEAITIGERSGVPVHLSQLRMYRSSDAPGPSQVLDRLEAARARGVRITASQNPYTTVGGTFDAHFLSHLLSNLDPEAMPEVPTGAALGAALSQLLVAIGPENMLLTRYPPAPEHAGQSVASLASRLGKTAESLLDELYRSEAAFIVMQVFSERACETLMCGEHVFTSSNGEVAPPGVDDLHPRSFAAFIRKLAVFSRDRRVLPMRRALQSMTVGPADFLGLEGRGRLEVGAFADLVLLRVEALDDRLDYCEPQRYPCGIERVFVNGVSSLHDGATFGGALLERRQAHAFD